MEISYPNALPNFAIGSRGSCPAGDPPRMYDPVDRKMFVTPTITCQSKSAITGVSNTTVVVDFSLLTVSQEKVVVEIPFASVVPDTSIVMEAGPLRRSSGPQYSRFIDLSPRVVVFSHPSKGDGIGPSSTFTTTLSWINRTVSGSCRIPGEMRKRLPQGAGAPGNPQCAVLDHRETRE
jgi:hypothetical protein